MTKKKNGSKGKGHSPKIESLAAKTMRDKSVSKTTKSLAASILSGSDGKPNKPKRKR